MRISAIILTASCLLCSQTPLHAFGDSTRVGGNKRPVYRASTKRASDVIHTRLDVSFDWEKSQMNGKAQITARPHFYPSSKLDLNARGMEIRSVEVFDLGKGKITDL